MANPEHVKMLKRGQADWIRWRKKHWYDAIDLSGADLRKADLARAYLEQANLAGADLRGAKLKGANLSGANLREANLAGARLQEANLSWAKLEVSSLTGARLRRADLTGASLNGADLSEAGLAEANLRRADLTGTNLREANLTEANLTWANLTRADLTGADFSDTSFGATMLTDTQGLDRCRHRAASNLDQRTLANNRRLPKVFLRGCGLSDLDIEAYRLKNPSLSSDQIAVILNRLQGLVAGKVPSYHSCFISFSSKNEEFVRRLHDDLQDAGVRCWFAPEDLKIGSKIRPSIDAAIHVQEKLLLILSEHSIKSQWVEQEVEKALERERKEDALVLFPVCLDAAVFAVDVGWASFLKNTRNIGDFTGWDDPGSYAESLQRLLRDLQAT